MIFRRFLSVPAQGLFKLSDKRLISIRGPDAAKFLNGLTTTKLLPSFTKKNQYTISDADADSAGSGLAISDDEIRTTNWGIIHEDSFLENDDVDKIGIRRDGLYSMLLNSKGRVLSDLFIYPTPFSIQHQTASEPHYLLEIDQSLINKIFMMLNLHKLKSEIKISKVSNHSVWYYYNESLQFNQLLSILEENYFSNANNKSAVAAANSSSIFIDNDLIFDEAYSSALKSFAIDNRSYLNGIKFITTDDVQDPAEIFAGDFKELIQPDLGLQDLSLYHLRNYEKGIVEKQYVKDIETLPFEHNLDFMNGISYDKGCYTGQELTIRTKNHGIIRKRIMPFVVLTDSKGDEPLDPSFSKDLTSLEVPAPEEEKQQLAASPFGNSRRGTGRKQIAGKILSMQYNYGFILLNLKYFSDNVSVEFKDFELDGHVIRVYRPDFFVQEGEEEDDD